MKQPPRAACVRASGRTEGPGSSRRPAAPSAPWAAWSRRCSRAWPNPTGAGSSCAARPHAGGLSTTARETTRAAGAPWRRAATGKRRGGSGSTHATGHSQVSGGGFQRRRLRRRRDALALLGHAAGCQVPAGPGPAGGVALVRRVRHQLRDDRRHLGQPPRRLRHDGPHRQSAPFHQRSSAGDRHRHPLPDRVGREVPAGRSRPTGRGVRLRRDDVLHGGRFQRVHALRASLPADLRPLDWLGFATGLVLYPLATLIALWNYKVALAVFGFIVLFYFALPVLREYLGRQARAAGASRFETAVPPKRTAVTSARMPSAVSSAPRLPRSSPIGPCTRAICSSV